MLTAKTQYNLTNAREYFEEHLCVGDYYDEGQRVSGHWIGTGAEKLGLSGKVRADDFLRLCENQHPKTGETLTQRLNTVRIDNEKRRQSTAGCFFMILHSHRPSRFPSWPWLVPMNGSFRLTIKPYVRLCGNLKPLRQLVFGLEAGMATDPPQILQRRCSPMTLRAPLDPHLHTHCVVFNATFDPVEQRWKALQNYEMLLAKKFAENVYYHELARQLKSFGYEINNHSRGDFQIEGISETVCERFSKRDAEVDKALAKLLAEKPELSGANLKEMRATLAVKTRARKQKDLSRAELRTMWDAQLSDAERNSLRQLSNRSENIANPNQQVEIGEAVQWAEDHLFDRNSVVLECQLWQQALERARAENFTVTELKEFTRQRNYIRNAEHPNQVTLRKVLSRELEIVQSVKDGVGDCRPIVENPRPANPKLDDEQRKALDALLHSTNTVSLFRGGAGTGKSFVLRELVDQIGQTGRGVIVLAPQRQQVVDMESAGFPSPTTITNFLIKGELAAGAVIVVDEAGQIGGRQMHQLLQLARERNARVILSGDTRQHGAVEASDALLAIERYSGIAPVQLHTIRRQDPALARNQRERAYIKQYRKAVEAAADGKLVESFKRLDQMGAIVACGMGEQADKLAEEYIRLAEQKSSAVVVSQTWAEVHRVNSRVREALKSKGLLGANDVTVQVLEKSDLTNAQKRDQRFYPKDGVIVFNQKVRQAAPGASGKLLGIVKIGVLVEVDGKCVTVANKQLDKITVCLPREIPIAGGERLHLKANRNLAAGARTTNGELVTVKTIRSDGGIELADGRVLGKNFREFLPGYAVTSYGSQGKTVDHVLFSDSTIKAATNAQQWYVTISRGRRGIRIFTPDKIQLRENLVRSGHRPLAMELGQGLSPRHASPLWDRLHGYLLRFGQRAADTFCRLKKSHHHKHQQKHEHKITRMLHH